MKTIQDVLDWLQEAENNGIYTCGTQNVKRHLEAVQKHQALSQHGVIGTLPLCQSCGKGTSFNIEYNCFNCGKPFTGNGL